MRPTILVVDDNQPNLRLTATLLSLERYMVLLASDAESAQVIIERTKPDLVLLDIQLPKMDGLTFAKLIKADTKLKHVRVVALSAHAMPEDIEAAMSAGFDGYITKPIDTREFPILISDILARFPK